MRVRYCTKFVQNCCLFAFSHLISIQPETAGLPPQADGLYQAFGLHIQQGGIQARNRAKCTNSSISAWLMVKGGAIIMRSPTARITKPLPKQCPRQIIPTASFELNRSPVVLFFKISNPATKPNACASATNGWSFKVSSYF